MGIASLFGARLIDPARGASPGNENQSVFKGKTFASSGNNALDHAMIELLKRITNLLGIQPGFKYINEDSVFTTRETVVEGTSGTIFLGVPLLSRLLDYANGGALIAGVCARECGHIYQYEYDLFDRLKEKGFVFVELHADFIAGYCWNKLSVVSARDLNSFLIQFVNIDYAHLDADRRGTLQQRTAALREGFLVANEGTPISVAAESGLLFVMNK